MTVQRHQVIVHYALTGSARLTLAVQRRHGRAWVVAARTMRRRGSGTITWNRKINRRIAGHGAYTLTLTATNGKRKSHVTRRIKI